MECSIVPQFILFQLMPYILFDLIRIFPYCIHIISSAPKFAVSVLILQLSKLLIDHQTTLTFQIPHKTRYAHFWGDFDQHMDVIRAAFRFDLLINFLDACQAFLSILIKRSFFVTLIALSFPEPPA